MINKPKELAVSFALDDIESEIICLGMRTTDTGVSPSVTFMMNLATEETLGLMGPMDIAIHVYDTISESRAAKAMARTLVDSKTIVERGVLATGLNVVMIARDAEGLQIELADHRADQSMPLRGSWTMTDCAAREAMAPAGSSCDAVMTRIVTSARANAEGAGVLDGFIAKVSETPSSTTRSLVVSYACISKAMDEILMGAVDSPIMDRDEVMRAIDKSLPALRHHVKQTSTHLAYEMLASYSSRVA